MMNKGREKRLLRQAFHLNESSSIHRRTTASRQGEVFHHDLSSAPPILAESRLAVPSPYADLMKYSLRSLMTFSIRDLFWLTVVIALVVAWWIDRNRATEEARLLSEQASEAERRLDHERTFITGMLKAKSNYFHKSGKTLHLKWTPGQSQPPADWWLDELAAEAATANMPNSSAPAPNPPKP